jgi:thioesterase domain-containing protein
MTGSRFLVPIKRSGTQSPAFIVPSAGTTVLSLVRLGRGLTTDRPLYAFEFTELPSDEKRPVSIEQIADFCIDQMRRVSPTGPYVVAGQCWGGLIAFAIAAHLEAASEDVAGVYLLESLPPTNRKENDSGGQDRAMALDFMLAKVEENLARLPDGQKERFGPLSWELIDIARRYRPLSRINAPVRLFRTRTHPGEVFQSWGDRTAGDFAEEVVAGDAFSMVAAPHVEPLCRALDNAFRADGV